LSPQEAEAFGDLGPQACRLKLPLFLERRPDRRQRHDREGIRRAVDSERQRAADGEQRAAERRSGEVDRGRARPLSPHRGGKLASRHDRTQCAGLGDAEDDRPGDFRERNRGDQRPPRMVELNGHGETGEHQRPHDIGADHQRLAVPGIGRDANRQREERIGREPREADQAGLRGRARQCENEQRVGDPRRRCSCRGEEPAALEQDELTVPPQLNVPAV
jgi:hypothetical protein